MAVSLRDPRLPLAGGAAVAFVLWALGSLGGLFDGWWVHALLVAAAVLALLAYLLTPTTTVGPREPPLG